MNIIQGIEMCFLLYI